ncbi:venom carboxylesterase-6-like [Lutzomyia longipalpis]|uniref:venom carboxylesterase-6-like n=1 Tax=Lutzomyia longipalpis TaxID=7200 RepID=UPI002483D5C4|nr:venom carboxylesterase-6-like [Lutzomyia longipalpis]
MQIHGKLVKSEIFLILGIVFLLFGDSNGRISDSLKVTLSHGGGIIGRYLRSFRGHGIRAFMGIPYAEPPIGSLRFNNPVPKSAWSGYLETVSNEAACPQFDMMRRKEYIGKEDCLYVNVYSPQFPNTTENLPVMVFFHGGGFQQGSPYYYTPDFFLDHDVVLVVGNYRLGALGFLTTNTSDSSGNFGLKDMVEILKWVQQNIGAFGGNRDQVTIFGQSAGGASVTYLMSYPSAKGLFHRAISQSGTLHSPWTFKNTTQALQMTLRLAHELRCERGRQDNWSKLVECLRHKSAESIVQSTSELHYWMGFPLAVFNPTLEKDREGAFVAEHPENIVRDNHGQNIPLLIGLTSEEGAFTTASITDKPRLVQELNDQWRRILPHLLFYGDFNEDRRTTITESINTFYFNGKEGRPAIEMLQNFTNVFTDFVFLKGFNKFLQRRFGENQDFADTYVYLFSHRGEGSYSDLVAGPNSKDYGVCHGDDIFYLFPYFDKLSFRSAPSSKDILMQETLVKLWVNFATQGKPTPVENLDIDWVPADKFPFNYLRIGNYRNSNKSIFGMENDLWGERSEFMRNIY